MFLLWVGGGGGGSGQLGAKGDVFFSQPFNP